jgi:polyisoprenoid-binding protein YceI
MKKLFAIVLLLAGVSSARAADIDIANSKITVFVEKSGVFSAFAHNHTIAAPLASGHLDVQKRTVELNFRTQEMKILDPGVSASEIADIDRTMKGDKVLDAGRFPEIAFASTSVESSDPQRYRVRGNLTLHGVTRPVELTVTFSEGRYTGKVRLKQTDFGITPVKIAGGAVKVKDAIEIAFDIATSK